MPCIEHSIQHAPKTLVQIPQPWYNISALAKKASRINIGPSGKPLHASDLALANRLAFPILDTNAVLFPVRHSYGWALRYASLWPEEHIPLFKSMLQALSAQARRRVLENADHWMLRNTVSINNTQALDAMLSFQDVYASPYNNPGKVLFPHMVDRALELGHCRVLARLHKYMRETDERRFAYALLGHAFYTDNWDEIHYKMLHHYAHGYDFHLSPSESATYGIPDTRFFGPRLARYRKGQPFAFHKTKCQGIQHYNYPHVPWTETCFVPGPTEVSLLYHILRMPPPNKYDLHIGNDTCLRAAIDNNHFDAALVLLLHEERAFGGQHIQMVEIRNAIESARQLRKGGFLDQGPDWVRLYAVMTHGFRHRMQLEGIRDWIYEQIQDIYNEPLVTFLVSSRKHLAEYARRTIRGIDKQHLLGFSNRAINLSPPSKTPPRDEL